MRHLLLSAIFVLAFAACGDDSDVTDAGRLDGGGDASQDAAGSDGGADTGADAALDTATPVDAGPDAPMDVGVDAPMDAGPPPPTILEGIFQDTYIKASNTGADDNFGYQVAVSANGTVVAVSTPFESSRATGIGGDQDNDGARWSGAVYVFRRSGEEWMQEAYLKASNADRDDEFGRSVAVSGDGNTIAVGAVHERSASDDPENDDLLRAGAAYVFEHDGTAWSQTAYLKANEPDALDQFGYQVALSGDGDVLAVGAPFEAGASAGVGGDESDDTLMESGAVFIYRRGPGGWGSEEYIKSPSPQPFFAFGQVVALAADGTTLAVYEKNNNGPDLSAVHVYRYVDDGWEFDASLVSPNAAPFDFFGSALSLSADGTSLAIGALQEDTGPVGAPLARAGAVYVFGRAAGSWSEAARIEGANADSQDYFGASLSLSGDGAILVVGAREESSNATGIDGDQANNDAPDAGALFVYQLVGDTWEPASYVKPAVTESFDQFGFPCALSADGSTLVVGARLEDSSAMGIGGDATDNGALESGAVYVFRGR